MLNACNRMFHSDTYPGYFVVVCLFCLSLVTIVQSLRLFGSLTPSFAAFNHGGRGIFLTLFTFPELLRVAFAFISKIVQGLFQNGQQGKDPLIVFYRKIDQSSVLTPSGRFQSSSLITLPLKRMQYVRFAPARFRSLLPDIPN